MPQQSFDIDGCRAMLRKLEYEYELCRSTEDRRYLSFHLVNFAMTAYQLIEWVWADLKELQPIRTKLEDELKLELPPTKSGKGNFFNFSLNHCPGLRVCQGIANGTKHVEYDGRRAVHGMTAYVSAMPSTIISGVSDSAAPPDVLVFTGTPKVIVDGDKSGDVRDIYLQTLEWWRHFILGHKIDRFNGPNSAI